MTTKTEEQLIEYAALIGVTLLEQLQMRGVDPGVRIRMFQGHARLAGLDPGIFNAVTSRMAVISIQARDAMNITNDVEEAAKLLGIKRMHEQKGSHHD